MRRCGLPAFAGEAVAGEQCDREAVGVVEVYAPEVVDVLVCDRHLAALKPGPIDAVFDEGLPQPKYPASHQPHVTLDKEPA